jgi:16S rRNA (guanine527-N7)-methyltransferase
MTESTNQALFQDFLQGQFPAEAGSLMSVFEQYLELLYTKNQIVNMVSRRMSKQDYWLYHFLDSLLIRKVLDTLVGKVLDFGSGGGLPGIPLKLVFPAVEMVLLDSVGKKVTCLQEMILGLELIGCAAVWSRLEDFASKGNAGSYDYILCRAVQMEDRFIPPMHKLLNKNGKVIFYKAQKSDDVSHFSGGTRYEVSTPELGIRQIFIIPKSSLQRLI